MPGLPTLEDFQPRIGEAFLAAIADGGTLTLVLTEAVPLPAHPYPGEARAPFSLLFAGPAATELPQATWTLTNQALGTLPIFIVPIRRDGDRVVYQAVFT